MSFTIESVVGPIWTPKMVIEMKKLGLNKHDTRETIKLAEVMHLYNAIQKFVDANRGKNVWIAGYGQSLMNKLKQIMDYRLDNYPSGFIPPNRSILLEEGGASMRGGMSVMCVINNARQFVYHLIKMKMQEQGLQATLTQGQWNNMSKDQQALYRRHGYVKAKDTKGKWSYNHPLIKVATMVAAIPEETAVIKTIPAKTTAELQAAQQQYKEKLATLRAERSDAAKLREAAVGVAVATKGLMEGDQALLESQADWEKYLHSQKAKKSNNGAQVQSMSLGGKGWNYGMDDMSGLF